MLVVISPEVTPLEAIEQVREQRQQIVRALESKCVEIRAYSLEKLFSAYRLVMQELTVGTLRIHWLDRSYRPPC